MYRVIHHLVMDLCRVDFDLAFSFFVPTCTAPFVKKILQPRQN